MSRDGTHAAEERIAALLREDFARADAPGPDAVERGLEAAWTRVGTAPGSRPMARRRPIRLAVAAAVGAVALVAAVAILGRAIPLRPVPDALVLQRALAAAHPSVDEIVHFVVETREASGEVSRRPTWSKSRAECWVDVAAKASRYQAAQTGSRARTAIVVRGGRTVVGVVDAGRVRARSVDERPEPVADPTLTEVTGYQRMLLDGTARVLGRGRVDGIETYRIESVLTTSPFLGFRPDGREKLRFVADIAVSDYRPVRIASFHLLADGTSVPLEVRDFSVWETVSRESLPRDAFEAVVPTDVPYTRRMTVAEARAFTTIPVYWVGERFEGWALWSHGEETGITYAKNLPVFGKPGETGIVKPGEKPTGVMPPTVGVSYWGKDGRFEGAGLGVATTPRLPRDSWPDHARGRSNAAASPRWFMLSGRAAMQLGSTIVVDEGEFTVTVGAETPQTALRAAEHLQRLR